MRIAYFINQYPKVSHTFIRREIMALERLGFSIQRISLRGWDEKLIDSDDINEQSLTHYVLKGGMLSLFKAAFSQLLLSPVGFFKALIQALKMGFRADRPMIFHIVYFLEACKVSQLCQQFQSQHMHAHFGTNPSEVVMLAALMNQLPYSFTVHGPEEFDRPQFLKLAEKINQSKFVVAISSFGRSQLQRWIPYANWNKVNIVHCGLEPSFYEIPAVPIPTAPKLVCVGRLCEQKGQLLLIEAAKDLSNQHIDFHLTLAGDGEMRAEIEALIKKYQLQDKVHITGWISSDQVRQHILESQALVLPSFAEGLPVVIMEAMSLRRPVLSTYIAGIPELIDNGINGWLFPAGSVDALSMAIQHMLKTPKTTLKEMGDAAYIKAIARHNINIEAQKLASLFKGQTQ